MAYIPVGTFIGENNTPNAINIPGIPSLAGIVGIGSRVKTVANEEHTRGEVLDETLTVAGSAPHTATLALRSNRSLQTTTVYRDGSALSDSFVSFNAPFILGTSAGTYDVTTNNAIAVSLDGLPFVTILFVNGAPGTTVVGSQVTVSASLSGAGAAATRAEIAAAINTGLAALTAAGYGAAYATVASDATTGIMITSPIATPSANVSVMNAIATSATTAIFGAAGASNRNAQSIITISALVYNASSVYTIDYVDIDSTADTLDNASVMDIVRVGTFQGVGNFEQFVDYQLTGDTVDWDVEVPATFTGTVAETYDISTNDNLRISLDGRVAVTIDLNGLASPPLGYANPSSAAAATAAEIVANINAVLANSVAYGAEYDQVASVETVAGSDYVGLTSPTNGEAGSITIEAPASLSATLAIFGLSAASLPYTVVGSGVQPAIGSAYFATYDITRPDADYNVQKIFYSTGSARADLGFANTNNPLMCGVEVAFRQGAQSVAVVQVDDSSLPGSPTRQEFDDAIAATLTTDAITELVVLSTSLDVQVDIRDHVETASSKYGQRWRRAWMGMPRNTSPGDRDTANTFVYRATRTLQVSPESPGRGRYFIVAPPQLTGVSVTYTLEDGSTETVDHDSTILAVAAAARRSSLGNVADTLSKKNLGGFNTSDITAPWSLTQVNSMASQGVFVIQFDGGNFAVLDPVSTEAGGGGVAKFLYDNGSPQKDNLTRKLVQASNANLIGRVPSSLTDFIQDVKLTFGGVISGEIGNATIAPYTTQAGTIRGINYNTDIDVVNDPNDPTQYEATYGFFLRYPALRIGGIFTTDSLPVSGNFG